jgi:hypothetical protein
LNLDSLIIENTRQLAGIFYGLLVVGLGAWVQKGSIGVDDGTGVF